VLVEDPELGAHLPESELAQARRAAIAPIRRLETGSCTWRFDESSTSSYLGLLVLEGVLSRHAVFGHTTASELMGRGDVLRPWVSIADEHPVPAQWEVLVHARIAVLDSEFASRVRQWPQIASALLDRSRRRTDSQLTQSAIRQARRVEDRVLLVLWHFAQRWGEATSEGLVMPEAKITGELWARIVGARRQSVSSAMGSLTDRGAIRRRPDGRLVLPLQPPELDAIRPLTPPPGPAHGRRASDRDPGTMLIGSSSRNYERAHRRAGSNREHRP
jgi:CRP-like cAMP-binding protein